MKDDKDTSIIVNRLKKNLRIRKPLFKNKLTNAYRLYEKDIPEYPYIVDVYNDYAVIYEKGKNLDQDNIEMKQKYINHRDQLLSAINHILEIPQNKIIIKERKKQKGKNQYEQLSKKDFFFNVTENAINYRINVYDYLDTGLFLDHRPLRAIIKNESQDKKVLNLFSYTGSISTCAAIGGAKVTTVDMSKTYIEWAKKNFVENKIDLTDHTFIQADVLKYIDEGIKEKFDLIILDPPSFSNSKRMNQTFDVQRDHAQMINKLMKILNKDGVLYFSNNFRKFQIDPLLTENFKVKDMSFQSIPIDFRDKKIHVCFKIKHK